MPIPSAIARFNRRVTNRVTGRFAGTLPGFGIVHHVGRKSGRAFATPVNCFRDGDDIVFALTYGPDADWVKNVRAAGACELVTRGKRIRLTNPRVYTDTSRPWASAPVRAILALTNTSQNLRMTRAV